MAVKYVNDEHYICEYCKRPGTHRGLINGYVVVLCIPKERSAINYLSKQPKGVCVIGQTGIIFEIQGE